MTKKLADTPMPLMLSEDEVPVWDKYMRVCAPGLSAQVAAHEADMVIRLRRARLGVTTPEGLHKATVRECIRVILAAELSAEVPVHARLSAVAQRLRNLVEQDDCGL